MTVYLVNSPKSTLDLSSAARFGEFQLVNIGYIHGDQLTDDGELPRTFIDNIRKHAAAFNPERDYLLIVGDHLQLVAFSAELARRHPHFKVLRYDRIERAYFPATISDHGRFHQTCTLPAATVIRYD